MIQQPWGEPCLAAKEWKEIRDCLPLQALILQRCSNENTMKKCIQSLLFAHSRYLNVLLGWNALI